jgi:hypothetical protein
VAVNGQDKRPPLYSIRSLDCHGGLATSRTKRFQSVHIECPQYSMHLHPIMSEIAHTASTPSITYQKEQLTWASHFDEHGTQTNTTSYIPLEFNIIGRREHVTPSGSSTTPRGSVVGGKSSRACEMDKRPDTAYRCLVAGAAGYRSNCR